MEIPSFVNESAAQTTLGAMFVKRMIQEVGYDHVSAEDVGLIRSLHPDLTIDEIAEKFEISLTLVSAIIESGAIVAPKRRNALFKRHKGPKPTYDEVVSALKGRTIKRAAEMLGYSDNGFRYVAEGYGIDLGNRLTLEA